MTRLRAAYRVLGFLLIVVPAFAQSHPGKRIQRLLATSPVAQTAFWGVEICDLQSGRMLFQRNEGHFFVPASNTKLFTTALALSRLGPDYRFHTVVKTRQQPDTAGLVPGDLALAGGGDPNLSARAIPYKMGAPSGNPLQAIEDLADQVIARGVRRIDGSVTGDDTVFVWQPYGPGWGIEDPIFDDGAPVSALAIHDNTFSLDVLPGSDDGDLARLRVRPPLEYFEFDNRVRTGNRVEKKIHVDRSPGSHQVRVWGSIPHGDAGQTVLLAIDDPALYAAQALHDALLRRGVAITREPRARHLFPDDAGNLDRAPPAPQESSSWFELARRTSAPLLDSLRVVDKVSQNLHAEMTLRSVALARRNIGSLQAGIAELQDFLDEAGLDRSQYSFHDGSGLSRYNLVTPHAVVQLLRHMYASPLREQWLSLLPVAGEDGTLSSRLGGSPAAGRIRAKTGSLNHVSALSGYAQRRDGATLVFSIFTNNYNAPPSAVRAIIDRICVLMLE